MKNKELKKRFRNKFMIRVAAGVLTVTLLGTGIGVYTAQAKDYEKGAVLAAVETGTTDTSDDDSTDLSDASDETKEEVLTAVLSGQANQTDRENQKEETVYVVSDAGGKQQKVIVSEWLKNPENATELNDATDLKDVKNVKGDETFTEGTDGSLTWKAEGKDIYYQGTTEKELPVEMKITYTLDGKEIAPEELAGKSGKVTIRMDYTNKQKVQTEVNGRTEEVYVPFTAITGMILSDRFDNVEVTNGKLISDGKNQVVVGVAMPGLNESLKIEDMDFDSKLEIPDYVEVSADVKDFSLDMTLTMIMSDVLSDLKLGDVDLTDETEALKSAVNEYVTGVNSLRDGVNSYTQGASKLSDGITSLKKGTDTLTQGVGTLVSAVGAISDSFRGEEGLMSGAAALAAGVKKLDVGLNTAMTDSEKKQAEAQADAAVEKNFEDGTKQKIADEASAEFVSAIKAGKKSLGEQLCSSELYDTMVEASYQQKVFEAYQEEKDTIDGVIAQYAAKGVEMSITQVVEASYKKSTGRTLRSDVEATVTKKLKDTVAPEILEGIASSGSQAMGESVAAACKEAAKTAAKTAAITGAESAKAQVAAQIEKGGLVTGADELSAGVNKLYNEGISPLKNGVDSMAAQLPTLSDGIYQLYKGGIALVSNNDALNGGAKTLAEATNRLADTYHDDVQPLLERVDAVLNAGESYHTFTKLADGMEGSVKFIIRTEAVKTEE